MLHGNYEREIEWEKRRKIANDRPAEILDGGTGNLDARLRDCVVDRKEDNLRSTVELGSRAK